MMRDFHMSRDYVMDELPMVEAFAYRAWSAEANPFGGVDRVSDGYIAQEIQKQ
jgi:hypothetical protein